MTPRLLKAKEAAKYLNISLWRLRQLVTDGLPYIQYGEGNAAWYFDLHDLDEFIERSKVRI